MQCQIRTERRLELFELFYLFTTSYYLHRRDIGANALKLFFTFTYRKRNLKRLLFSEDSESSNSKIER